jgi:hypothetical protein
LLSLDNIGENTRLLELVQEEEETRNGPLLFPMLTNIAKMVKVKIDSSKLLSVVPFLKVYNFPQSSKHSLKQGR